MPTSENPIKRVERPTDRCLCGLPRAAHERLVCTWGGFSLGGIPAPGSPWSEACAICHEPRADRGWIFREHAHAACLLRAGR